MSYPYRSHQIQEFLTAPKCLPDGNTLELKPTRNGGGMAFDTRPQLIDGPFVDFRYVGNAPLLEEPTTYEANFLIANQRVRGVGYCEVGRGNLRYKRRIPKGWHLNVCDPNLPTNDDRQNIHQPLPDFSITDLRNFINQTAAMWKIDLGQEWQGDLF